MVRTTATSPTITLGRSAEDVARDLVLQLKPQTASSGGGGQQEVRRAQHPHPHRGGSGRAASPRGACSRSAAPGQPEQGSPSVAAPPSPSSPFGLTVRPRSVDRRGRSCIVVSSRSDCRLTLIDVRDGKAVQLFPNSFQRENLIRAGQVITIPAPQSPFQFVVRGPTGAEAVLAICRADGVASQYPLDPGQSDFVTIGSAQSIARDLIVSSGQADTAARSSTLRPRSWSLND